MSALLHKLARAAGLAIDWVDADGRAQTATDDVLRSVLGGLELPAEDDEQVLDSLEKLRRILGTGNLPPLLTVDRGQWLDLSHYFSPNALCEVELENGGRLALHLSDHGWLPALDEIGYHTLRFAGEQCVLAVAPQRCFNMSDATGSRHPRAWGIGVQLYSLRRQGDGGVGDTQALECLARSAAQQGADALGISPVHAMFSADAQRYSPYSPSSRLFNNVLYSAPGSILGERALRQAIESAGLEAEMQRLEQLDLIDWPAVAATKQRLLRALYDDFRTGGNPQAEDFASFRRHGGEALENHCRFEALHAVHIREGDIWDWRHWPQEYRNPHSAAVGEFAREHADEVSYHAFCQWLIDRGLDRAQTAARSAGMHIGLISDLAVGADGGGSQAWSRQAQLLSQLTVGAPPDILNRSGQSWGISAFSPWGLKAHGFSAFIEMLRANFAHAGGMRIDHVMGLHRLWVMPAGASSDQGAYLHYPEDDLLRLLALESVRHHAIVLGEDLGTVPEGLRERLAARGILGMRVLLFEQDHAQHFFAPQDWPETAIATTSTHDLPPIPAWWKSGDIDWRARIDGVGEDKLAEQLRGRDREREGLRAALVRACGMPAQVSAQSPELGDAAAAFIGMTPAPLVLLPMEDALGLEEQPNLPGTIDEHPNWRRRWDGDCAELLDAPLPSRRLQVLDQARHRTEQN